FERSGEIPRIFDRKGNGQSKKAELNSRTALAIHRSRNDHRTTMLADPVARLFASASCVKAKNKTMRPITIMTPKTSVAAEKPYRRLVAIRPAIAATAIAYLIAGVCLSAWLSRLPDAISETFFSFCIATDLARKGEYRLVD